MKHTFSIVMLVALAILVGGDFGLAADENCQPASNAGTNAWYEQVCRDAPPDNPAAISTDGYLAGDSDRGCCVLKAPRAKCVYTNKAFCVRKARQANIGFDFHKGIECKTISACR